MRFLRRLERLAASAVASTLLALARLPGALERLELQPFPAPGFLRRLRLLTVLALVGAPLMALAQVEAPAPSSGLTFEQIVSAVLVVAVPVLVALGRLILKDRYEKIEEIVTWAIDVGYYVTDEVARKTETKIDDKIAFALGEFRKALASRGLSSNPGLEERAKLAFTAKHGLEKKTEALAELMVPSAPELAASPG